MTDITETQEHLSDELDETLLKGVRMIFAALKSGDKDIRGAAAFLNVVRQRLSNLGITKIATADDALSQLANELGLETVTLPPVSEDEEEHDVNYRAVGRVGV